MARSSWAGAMSLIVVGFAQIVVEIKPSAHTTRRTNHGVVIKRAVESDGDFGEIEIGECSGTTLARSDVGDVVAINLSFQHQAFDDVGIDVDKLRFQLARLAYGHLKGVFGLCRLIRFREVESALVAEAQLAVAGNGSRENGCGFSDVESLTCVAGGLLCGRAAVGGIDDDVVCVVVTCTPPLFIATLERYVDWRIVVALRVRVGECGGGIGIVAIPHPYFADNDGVACSERDAALGSSGEDVEVGCHCRSTVKLIHAQFSMTNGERAWEIID